VREEYDVELASGRLHVHAWGPAGGPLVLCVHGLSAHGMGFEPLAAPLAQAGFRVLAPDLRGRGRSEITPPGSYGLRAHARDVVALADREGAARFDVIGWSMGAIIGMEIAQVAPGRMRRLVLIDHAGVADEAAVDAVRAGLARLDATTPDVETYVHAMRDAGAAVPWDAHWEAYYAYELGAVEGGFSPTTDRAACTEDLDGGLATVDPPKLWSSLRLPVLLVRANAPLGGGLVVPEEERERMHDTVVGLGVVESERNHFGVMTDPETARSVTAFLTA
jgi:pimeloyl-ACP methyl ester carboxylesterase